jgi:hypothetical protein
MEDQIEKKIGPDGGPDAKNFGPDAKIFGPDRLQNRSFYELRHVHLRTKSEGMNRSGLESYVEV